mmetsp:Transcript_8023/g.16202  ORF Transcript_8023/g.16202 Transcript_8023/m.16202 type:complete len:404 (-) Transcript_8023:13-1224(-)
MLGRLFGRGTPPISESPQYLDGRKYEKQLLHDDASTNNMRVYDVDVDFAGASEYIHTAEVGAMKKKGSTPIVIMHGYGNGIGYLFQNLVPLSKLLPNRKIFGIDMLGFGLSSRPDWDSYMKKTEPPPSDLPQSVATAESWFVDSLESWRKAQKIDKMVLCGHSMGGYLSVAYSERYPERVEKLVLLSPVGVPYHDAEKSRKRMAQAPLKFRMLIKTVRFFWGLGATPMSVLRTMPEGQGKQLVDGYVYNRLRGLEDKHKAALSGYFYSINSLPGSGEYCLHKLLKVGAYARVPLVDRITNLKVNAIHFLYGQHDWMDLHGGLQVQEDLERTRGGDGGCSVRVVNGAGHLLMLENAAETNKIIANCVEGKKDKNDGSFRHHGQYDKSEWVRPEKTTDKLGEVRV